MLSHQQKRGHRGRGVFYPQISQIFTDFYYPTGRWLLARDETWAARIVPRKTGFTTKTQRHKDTSAALKMLNLARHTGPLTGLPNRWAWRPAELTRRGEPGTPTLGAVPRAVAETTRQHTGRGSYVIGLSPFVGQLRKRWMAPFLGPARKWPRSTSRLCRGRIPAF